MIVEINPANFQEQLIDSSHQKLIAVFFYAHEIPECQPLEAILEQQIGPENPMINLAKVNVADPQLQSLAMQMGLQQLPAVVLFKQGRPIDALMGPQDAVAVEQLLKAHQPAKQDLLLMQGKDLLANQQIQEAFNTLQEAHQLDESRADIKLLLGQAALALGKLERVQSLLESITMVDQDHDYHTLKSELDLALQAADSPEIRAVEELFAKEPNNTALKLELAVLYSQASRKAEALELLYSILQQEINHSEARKAFLDILATMQGDSIASTYRRKMYSLLY